MKQIEAVRDIVRRSRVGGVSEQDFERLLRLYYRRVLSSFPRQVSPADREELTQIVFLAVYRSIGGIPEDAFEEWLFRIAKNTFLTDHQRRHRLKRRGAELSWEGLAERGFELPAPRRSPDNSGPVEQLLHKERRELLWRAIDDLPERMRQCILLRIVDERTIQEIAALLGIADGTVKAHLAQARAKLKMALGDKFDMSKLAAEHPGS